MTNYQLYRTNVLLGGQMKYDLIVTNKKVTNIYISPISNNAPHKYSLDNILLYDHQENIKEFYKKNSSSFYKDFVSPRLTSVYPLPDEYKGERSDTTYEMGLKTLNRVRRQLYNKIYEFFCPLWLEKLDDIKNLKFRFEIYNISDKLILSQDIKIESGIADYLNKYLNFLNLKTDGCDWVFDINKNNCVVSGLNVQTGLPTDKKLFKLYDDLTFRERPLLEFNNLIINELNKNQLITKQLFNFNFCFNLKDILSGVIADMIHNDLEGNGYKITLKVFEQIHEGDSVFDSVLEVVDIFTNHHFIPKIDITPKSLTPETETETVTPKNVLDYLSDDKYIDLIYKNKILQNTCHWRLTDNNLHFNTYAGFTPFDRQYKIDIPYISENVFDISVKKPLENSSCWCKIYRDTRFNKNNIEELFDNDENFSRFKSGQIWINGVKYNYTPSPTDNMPSYVDVLCLMLPDKTKLGNDMALFKSNTSKLIYQCSDIDISDIYIIQDNLKLIFVYLQKDKDKIMHHKTLLNTLTKVKNPPKELIFLKDVLLSAQQPLEYIVINNGLKVVKTIGPSVNTNEIEYYKTQNSITLFRYFGKIKPYFIKTSNETYFNHKWCKLNYSNILADKSLYKKYATTQYQPLYPSIGYFTLGCWSEKPQINTPETMTYKHLYGWPLKKN